MEDAQPKCSRCLQLITADDTLAFEGHQILDLDCRWPRDLSPEERALLFKYCFDHAVAECTACAKSFRQEELGSDPFVSRTYECLQCRADLTENIRSHFNACTTLPEQLRHRVKVAREVTQRLIKRSYQLSARADVLVCEVEAALDELNETRERARRRRDQR